MDDDEIECMLVRPQEQPRYVQDGLIYAGFCWLDLIREAEADVVEVLDAANAHVSAFYTRQVLIVPEDSPIREVKDLEGKRIATELVNLTRSFLEEHGVQALVEYSYGATEVKPPLLADAIVDATVTGNSLRANNLRIIATLIESTPRFIASKQAWGDPWKRQKLEDIKEAIMDHGMPMTVDGRAWNQVLEVQVEIKGQDTQDGFKGQKTVKERYYFINSDNEDTGTAN